MYDITDGYFPYAINVAEYDANNIETSGITEKIINASGRTNLRLYSDKNCHVYSVGENDSCIKGSCGQYGRKNIEKMFEKYYPKLEYSFLMGIKSDIYIINCVDSSFDSNGNVSINALSDVGVIDCLGMSAIYSVDANDRSILGAILDYCKKNKNIVEQMKAGTGITEELKENDQMKLVGLMNNVQNAAEEIVIRELIYV